MIGIIFLAMLVSAVQVIAIAIGYLLCWKFGLISSLPPFSWKLLWSVVKTYLPRK